MPKTFKEIIESVDKIFADMSKTSDSYGDEQWKTFKRILQNDANTIPMPARHGDDKYYHLTLVGGVLAKMEQAIQDLIKRQTPRRMRQRFKQTRNHKLLPLLRELQTHFNVGETPNTQASRELIAYADECMRSRKTTEIRQSMCDLILSGGPTDGWEPTNYAGRSAVKMYFLQDHPKLLDDLAKDATLIDKLSTDLELAARLFNHPSDLDELLRVSKLVSVQQRAVASMDKYTVPQSVGRFEDTGRLRFFADAPPPKPYPSHHFGRGESVGALPGLPKEMATGHVVPVADPLDEGESGSLVLVPA